MIGGIVAGLYGGIRPDLVADYLVVAGGGGGGRSGGGGDCSTRFVFTFAARIVRPFSVGFDHFSCWTNLSDLAVLKPCNPVT